MSTRSVESEVVDATIVHAPKTTPTPTRFHRSHPQPPRPFRPLSKRTLYRRRLSRPGDRRSASLAVATLVVIYQSTSVLCCCNERTRDFVKPSQIKLYQSYCAGLSVNSLVCFSALDHNRLRPPRLEYERSPDSNGSSASRPNSSALGVVDHFAKSVASVKT